ncbi:XRE family transcriptional regulator [Pullulanibacillus camelliae]|uniref:XRE family transcriptional regulator n=1 Tax=Pullulanibacillus camelliae TaxID=1707096 RepID=A0A8J2YIU8_9BACL|nr:helix-turn-helix domain-containing protein [Pullulanibacillus camelliae]GGE46026.1 XRE family transcriptional regulator [Pullulanibacillus camelliae]
MSELGKALKEAREEKGLTLDDIQEATKIQKRYLVAIENGDYQLLPGQFYIRAFIKSYAETVGLDVQELFTQYASEVPNPAAAADSEIEKLPSRKERVERTAPVKSKATSTNVSSLLPKIIAVVALIAVIACIYFIVIKVNGGSDDKSSKASSNDDVTLQQGSDIGDHKSKKKSTDGATGETADKTADQKQSDSTKKATSKNDPSDQQNEDKPTQQTLKMTSQSGTASTYSLSDTDKFVVEVTAVDGKYSWLTASKDNASGERYYFANVAKGVNGQKDASFKKDLSSVQSLYLKIGNTTGAVVKVNGQVLKYPTDTTTQSLTINFKKS